MLSNYFLVLYGVDSFDDETRAYLDSFEIMDLQTDNGGILIRLPGNENFGMEVTGSSVEIAGMSDDQRLTDEGLEATLEAALMAKTLPHAETGIYAYDNNPEVALTLKLAADQVGLTVMNDDAIMNELPPEVDVEDYQARIEAAWQRVQARHEAAMPADPAAEAQERADFEAGAEPRPQPSEAEAEEAGAEPAASEGDAPESEYETAQTVMADAFLDTDQPMPENLYHAVLVTVDDQDTSRTLDQLKQRFNFEGDPAQANLRSDSMIENYAGFGQQYLTGEDAVTPAPEAVEAAAAVLTERGIEDPEGDLAQGLAAYATKVAGIANDYTGAEPPVPEGTPEGAGVERKVGAPGIESGP